MGGQIDPGSKMLTWRVCADFGHPLALGDGRMEGGLPSFGKGMPGFGGPLPPSLQSPQQPGNKRKFTGMGAAGALEKVPRSQPPDNGEEGSL